MIALAKKHNVHRIGVSYLLPGERGNSIEKLNSAAAACKAIKRHKAPCQPQGPT